jgi:hypothetical protein
VVFFFLDNGFDINQFDGCSNGNYKKEKPHALWNLIFEDA